jgi:DNA-binding beta-propeller fold protein YncE
VLAIDNGKVTYTRRDMRAGIQPYHMSMNPSGRNAVVGNNGRGGVGDIDTISVIDLALKPYRVVETVSVGQWVEGVVFSPDGRHVAAVSMNGSNRPKNYPFYNDAGKLVMFRLDGIKLTRIAEAPIGHWSQGVVFSPDGKTILVGNMVEKNLGVYRFDGTNLTDTGQRIAVKGGAAALGTAGGR